MRARALSARLILTTLAAVGLSCIPALAQTTSLRAMSFRDVLREALENSPALRGSQEAATLADIQQRLAASRFGLKVSPTLSAGSDPYGLGQQSLGLAVSKRLPFGTDVALQTSSFRHGSGQQEIRDHGYTFSVSQPLLRGFGPAASFDLKNARRAVEGTSRAIDEARRQLVQTMAEAYFGVLRDTRLAEASHRALERAAALKQASEARARVGLATQLDVLRADLLVSQAAATLASQRESLAGRLDQVKLLMGRDLDSDLRIAGDDLAELTREADVAAPADRLVALAWGARLDVREAADRVDDARRHERVARLNLLPHVNLTASYTRRGLGSPAGDMFHDLFGGCRGRCPARGARDRARRDQHLDPDQGRRARRKTAAPGPVAVRARTRRQLRRRRRREQPLSGAVGLDFGAGRPRARGPGARTRHRHTRSRELHAMSHSLLRRSRQAWNAMRRRRREAGAASVAALVLMAGGTSLVITRRGDTPWSVAAVREGRFVDALIESGTITAARLMLYGTTITGSPSKLAEIVPEGIHVAPGDLLMRFDTTSFEQALVRETAALQQAEADLMRVRQDLRLEALEVQADLETANQQVGYAATDLKNEVEGMGRLAIAEAEAAAADAAREVERTRAAFQDLKPLLTEGFITKAELDRAEQAWKRAEEQERLAVLRRDALVKYERPAAVDRARAAVDRARDDLSRKRAGGGSRLAQRQAMLDLAEAKVAELKARTHGLHDQISRALVLAQGAGLVVYRDLFFGSDRRKPQVGDEVWPNQPVIALPDSSQLTVETRVREVDLHKVAAKGRVLVNVDAYPDIRLRASVGLIGALAQEDPARAGTRFFPIAITLVDRDARLRPGMTARVEIEVATLPRTLIVPSQAVMERDGRLFCYVLREGRPTRVDVGLGGDNGIEAAVTHGLAARDVVLLTDPEGRPASRP